MEITISVLALDLAILHTSLHTTWLGKKHNIYNILHPSIVLPFMMLLHSATIVVNEEVVGFCTGSYSKL